MNRVFRFIPLGIAVMIAAMACSDGDDPAPRASTTTTVVATSTTETTASSALCETGVGYHAFVTGLAANPSVEQVRTRLLQSATWLGQLSTVSSEPLAGRLRVSARIRGELAASAATASSIAEIDAIVGRLTAVELTAYQQPPGEVEAVLEKVCGLDFD